MALERDLGVIDISRTISADCAILAGKVNKMLCGNRKQTRNRIPYSPVFEKTIKPHTAMSGTEYLILGGFNLRKGKCTSRME